MSSWHDLASARSEWSDVKGLPNPQLQDLLDATKDACWFFDPAHPRQVRNDAGDTVDAAIPAEVPVRFRIGQLLHARAIWQLPRGGSDGSVGVDGYTTRVYVLGYDVQKILIPPVYGEMVG